MACDKKNESDTPVLKQYHRRWRHLLFGFAERWPTHLGKVAHVEQVEGIKQLALLQLELALTHAQEGPDVLQAQELDRSAQGYQGI